MRPRKLTDAEVAAIERIYHNARPRHYKLGDVDDWTDELLAKLIASLYDIHYSPIYVGKVRRKRFQNPDKPPHVREDPPIPSEAALEWKKAIVEQNKKKKGRKKTTDQMKRMLQLRREGQTIKQIATALDISVGHVFQKLAGVARPRPVHPDYARIIELRQQGLSLRRIAKRVGLSFQRVGQIIRGRE